jgi:hypothetical protein
MDSTDWDVLSETSLPKHIAFPDPDIYLRSNNYTVLDFEATMAPVTHPANPDAKLVMACWQRHGVMKWCFGDEWQQGELVKDIEASDFIVAHNAKYELGWLKRCGMELRDIIPFCTATAEWVMSGGIRRPKGYYTLKESAIRRGIVDMKVDLMNKLWKVGIDTPDHPRAFLLERNRTDVWMTERLFRKQVVLLKGAA